MARSRSHRVPFRLNFRADALLNCVSVGEGLVKAMSCLRGGDHNAFKPYSFTDSRGVLIDTGFAEDRAIGVQGHLVCAESATKRLVWVGISQTDAVLFSPARAGGRPPRSSCGINARVINRSQSAVKLKVVVAPVGCLPGGFPGGWADSPPWGKHCQSVPWLSGEFGNGLPFRPRNRQRREINAFLTQD